MASNSRNGRRALRPDQQAYVGSMLIGLTAGLGIGMAVTACLTKYAINRRLAALPAPVRWAVKRLARSLAK